MKYSLQKNAFSSLSIAIDRFKHIYYYDDEQSIFEENIKMCAIFLENSVELLLKSILVLHDPLSIYLEPNSKKIQKAMLKVDKNNSLEDILIINGDFKTITYTEAINKCYNYYQSEKVKNILKELGYIRNSITHFGIVGIDSEYIIAFINVFDAIYNYLYPEIIEIEEISDYFTSDEMFVSTIHGYKPLFDKKFIYNNIVDFLDELMETSKKWCYESRLLNPKYKIEIFNSIFEDLLKTNNFKKLFSYYDSKLIISNSSDVYDYYLEIWHREEIWDCLMLHYSPYYNSSIFIGDNGRIYFRVDHSSGKIYIYDHEITLPSIEEKEFEDYEWQEHINKGFCKSYNLTKKHLKFAFEKILVEIKSSYE